MIAAETGVIRSVIKGNVLRTILGEVRADIDHFLCDFRLVRPLCGRAFDRRIMVVQKMDELLGGDIFPDCDKHFIKFTADAGIFKRKIRGIGSKHLVRACYNGIRERTVFTVWKIAEFLKPVLMLFKFGHIQKQGVVKLYQQIGRCPRRIVYKRMQFPGMDQQNIVRI